MSEILFYIYKELIKTFHCFSRLLSVKAASYFAKWHYEIMVAVDAPWYPEQWLSNEFTLLKIYLQNQDWVVRPGDIWENERSAVAQTCLLMIYVERISVYIISTPYTIIIILCIFITMWNIKISSFFKKKM